MADIELVIKIPEGLKKDFELEQWTALSCMEMKDALMNGTPLPEGHGRLFDEKDIVNGNYEIIGNKIYELEPIIEADKAESEDEE